MVEINNQRKAFLDMLAWSEGTDNGRQKTRKNGYDVTWRRRRLFTIYWLPDHPLVNPKPKTQKLKSTGAGRYQLLSRDGMPQAASSLAWKTSLRKAVGRCAALQRDWSVAYDWSWWLIVRQSTVAATVAAISGLHCRALVMVSSSIRLTAWLQKIQRSGRNGQRDWCMSRVTAIISALVICIIVCLSWAVNHYRDNAITYKAQRDKNARELKLANAAITDMQMRQRDVADARCVKCTRSKSWAKAENAEMLMLKMMMLCCRCRWSSSVAVKAVCQSVREATPPPAMDSPPTGRRLADTAGRDYPPSERGWSLWKNNWKEPRSILMSSADRVAHIDGQLMQLLWAIHTRFQRSINA